MKPAPSKPLITTIIPTYRRPKLLRRAICSVLNQTYPHFQVCVYDNASGDETAEIVAIIAKKDSRVKYHCHAENIGPIENFNYGMRNLTTPYFSLLSDDNVLLPHFFEDAISTLNHLKEPILFAGQTIFVNEKGQRIRGSLDFWQTGMIHPLNGLLAIVEKGLPNWESVLFRRQVIDNVGLLDPSFSGAADQDFLMRIARHHAFYVSKKEYAFFVYHKGSYTIKRDLSETVSIYKKRMEQWFQDEGLTADAKERIKKASRRIIQRTLVTHLTHKCIHGHDTETLNTAAKLMKQELGWSYKVLKSIILAKMVNRNRFFRKLVIFSTNAYGRIKELNKSHRKRTIQIFENTIET